MHAERAHVGGAEASAGSTVFEGERLSTEAGGILRINGPGLTLQLDGQSSMVIGRATGPDESTLAELAYLYQTRGNQGRAEELYKRAISLDPALLEVASNLAGQMALQGRIKEAMQLWEKALKGNPGFTAARINLVLGHLQQGDIGLARQALEKALQFNPELLSDEPLLRSVGLDRDGKN